MGSDLFQRLWTRFVARAPAAPAAPVVRSAGKAETQRAEELEAVAKRLVQQLGYEALAQRVSVRWNPRMRSTAGTAHFGKGLISLNPKLQAFGAEEVDRTLRHELAHLLAQHRAGRRRIAPHGAEWRQACRDLGLADEKRCHDLPLPRQERARPYSYRCPACAVEIRRVRPLRRRVACLRCCRQFSGGKYDERFRLAPQPVNRVDART